MTDRTDKEDKKNGKTSSEVECRCKESREKSFREILKTILKDILFWKRN